MILSHSFFVKNRLKMVLTIIFWSQGLFGIGKDSTTFRNEPYLYQYTAPIHNIQASVVQGMGMGRITGSVIDKRKKMAEQGQGHR